ncbi:MAG: DUF4190 domain-containing protein [Planctomycetota bacterium]|nr:DUF4190 domain-containing protein [Planctomycetota bacterium]
MPSEKRSKSGFEYPEEEAYSSIDSMAVFALFGGAACSLAVVFNPVFLAFGILGIVFGLLSLARIKRSDGILSGSRVAWIGVSLSLLFFAFYVSHAVSRDSRMSQTSRVLAEQWIEMIQDGNLNEAHQLTRDFFNRVLPGTSLAKHYASAQESASEAPNQKESAQEMSGTAYRQREDFFQQPAMKIIRDKGKACTVSHLGQVTSYRDGQFVDYVVHAFEVRYQENGQNAKNRFEITMLREVYPGHYGVHWAVDMIDGEYAKIDRAAVTESYQN